MSRWALPVAGGLVASLVLPPFDLLPAFLVGLAMLAVALRDAGTVREAAVLGTAWGVAGSMVGLRFVVETVDRFSGVGWIGGLLVLAVLALVQGAAWGLAGAVTVVVRRHARLPGPIAFAIGIFAGSSVPGIFAWSPATLLTPRPELVQSAEVIGATGASALLAAVVGLAVVGLPGRGRTAAVPLLVALVALVAVDRIGAARMDAVAGRPGVAPVAVGLLDQRAPARRTLDGAEQAQRLDRMLTLSRRAEEAGVEFVVWPEASYPVAVPRDARRLEQSVAGGARVPRLVGFRAEGGGRAWNAASVVDPDGRLQRSSDKRRLLWFGETPPPGGRLPLVRDLLPATSGVTAGDRPRPLTVARSGHAPVQVGVLICYEDIDAGTGRAVVRATGPQLLVGVTNDAWFAGTDAPVLQERLTRLRSIESRTPLVRAVNGGGGSATAADGRAVGLVRVGSGVERVVVTPRATATGQTLYVRFGEWPGRGFVLLLVLVGWARARRTGTLDPRVPVTAGPA